MSLDTRKGVRDDSRATPNFYYNYGNFTKTTRMTPGDIMADIGTLRAPFYLRGATKIYEKSEPYLKWIYRNRKDIWWYYKYLRGIGYSINYALWKISEENQTPQKNGKLGNSYSLYHESEHCSQCWSTFHNRKSVSIRCRKCFGQYRSSRQRQNRKYRSPYGNNNRRSYSKKNSRRWRRRMRYF